jgi:hypothetical protein
MEGSVQGRQVSLGVQRDFAGSRLEEQILIRVFELVTPAIRRTVGEIEKPGTTSITEQVHSILAKGA